jgi:hypothetical protein
VTFESNATKQNGRVTHNSSKTFFLRGHLLVFFSYIVFEKKSLLAVRKIEGQRPYPKSTHGNGMGTG